MSKVNRKKQKKKKNILIVMSILLFVNALFLIMTISLDKKNLEIKKKISNLDNLYNDIILLKKQRSSFDKVGKQIEEINNKNNLLNKEIDALTNNIRNLDEKISKYGK